MTRVPTSRNDERMRPTPIHLVRQAIEHLGRIPYVAWAMLLSGVVLLTLTQINVAEDPESPPVAADESQSDKARETSIREQTIYVPYDELEKTFEKEGRGIFLPYEKYRELWDAARKTIKETVETHPPVGVLISETINEAEALEDVVQVESRLSIELLTKGWHQVPLRLAGSAITSATIDGEPARITHDAKLGYQLLLEKRGDSPERRELVLRYAKAIDKSPGRNSVSFQSPQASMSRWRMRIPEAGVRVDIEPHIAATEDVGEGDSEEAAAEGETVVLAFVGAAPEVRIAWTPKAEGATGLAALASVESAQEVSIDEGVMRTSALLNYTITRAELANLSLRVPSDQKVVRVDGANVRQWSVESEGDLQTISIQLFEPAKGSETVRVDLERFLTKASEEATAEPLELDLPLVETLGVGRQQGNLTVRVDDTLTSEAVSTVGLLQLDSTEQGSDYSYRFASVPFGLKLRLEKIQPRIVADSLVRATLQPERLSLDMQTVYTIERAGVFRLELEIPDGYDVRRVQGNAIGGATPVAVDTHHLQAIDGSDQKRLVVNLSRKALGPVGLNVRLEREINEPDLLTPTGNSIDLPLDLPRVAPAGVERASGRLILLAPESLRTNPTEADGLRAVSIQEATAGMPTPPPHTLGDARVVLAYAYGEEPVSLSLSVERRKPQVIIRQLVTANIEDGVAKYKNIFFYDVRYSGVKNIRIDIPSDVAARLRNNSPTIREKVIQPPPADLTEGCVAWSLSGETELLGAGRIDLEWERELQSLEVGRTIELSIPRITPINVDRTWGQVILSKAETMDISPSGEPEGLRRVDAQHDLMSEANVTDAALAFEFSDQWELTVAATRYDLEEVKRTSIERAVIKMVVTRAEKTTVQALYRIRTARQRLAIEMPSGATFDVEPRLDGEPISLESEPHEGGTRYFVPLSRSTLQKPALLELRYTRAGSGLRMAWPTFPAEPAMQKVYLCVYLPEEIKLIAKSGPWTENFPTRFGARGQAVTYLAEGDDPNSVSSLLKWVASDVEMISSFPTDGQVYIFSALRPGSPEKDALNLTPIPTKLLYGAVVGIVLLGGLLLLPMGARNRVFGVGILAITLLIVAIFQPILVRAVCDRVLVAALFAVAILWTMKFAIWTLPKCCSTWRSGCCIKPVGHEKEEAAPPEEEKQPDARGTLDVSFEDLSAEQNGATDDDSDKGGSSDA